MHTSHKNKSVAEKVKLEGNMNESVKMAHMADMISKCKGHVIGEEEYGSELV